MQNCTLASSIICAPSPKKSPNCIAHKDYTLEGRITLVENDGYLYYSNRGSFIPETIEKVLTEKGPQKIYRNTCLTHGMVHFNL